MVIGILVVSGLTLSRFFVLSEEKNDPTLSLTDDHFLEFCAERIKVIETLIS